MKNINNILFLIMILQFRSFAQPSKTEKLSRVDSIVVAMKLNNCRDLEILTDTLMVPFVTDSEKVRAIYFWITENISYDCVKFHKMGPERTALLPEGQDEEKWEYKMISDVVVKRKGICQDYADLFNYMCEAAKIPCKVINGYGTSAPVSNIFKFNEEASNHAWNMVMINKKWYLIDCTWASGYSDVNCTKFTKKRCDLYYLTPPVEFIKDHHPTQKEWQLLDPPMEMDTWVKQTRNRK